MTSAADTRPIAGPERREAKPIPAELSTVPALSDAAGASLETLGGGRVLLMAVALVAMTGFAMRSARSSSRPND